MNNKFNGERLKSARIFRGLTLEELAEKVGVKRQTISLYETGKILPEVENLYKLIKILKFPRKFFFQNEALVHTGTAYFRALLTTNKKYREQQKLQNKFRGNLCKFLLNYMDFPESNLPFQIKYDDDMEAYTRAIRRFWSINDEPIRDIVYLLEKNGLIVLLTETDTNDIDAFNQSITLSSSEERYIIVLSKNKPSAARIQFDGAHELAHILLHPKNEDIECLSREQFKALEKQANEFAASLLLPKEAFIADLPERYRTNLDYYVKLKRKWNVSISAMIIRAYNLGLMTYNQYQYLMKKISQRGWRVCEPLDNSVNIPEPTVLKYSVDILLDNDVFTTQSLIETINNDFALEPSDIENLLGLECGKLSIAKNKIVSIIPKLKGKE